MNVPKREFWRWAVVLSALCGFGLFACETSTGFTSSGESHFGKTSAFLRICEDGTCESGDDCTCAVCTVACNEIADCAERILGPGAEASELPDSVRCQVPACGTDQSSSEQSDGPSGDSVCDVVCETDADCDFLDEQAEQAGQTLESEHFCHSGFCRTSAEPEVPDPDAATTDRVCPAGRELVPGIAAPDGIGLCVDQTEVTVAQYRTCVEAGDCTEPAAGNYLTAMRDDHPVNFVGVEQAVSYCGFADGRLPTEAEWSSAAAGGDTADSYPWGNQEPTVDDMPDLVCALDEVGTCVAASFPDGNGPYGHSDLAGNVAELVSTDGAECAAGGSYESMATDLTASSCVAFDTPVATVGFRCVSDL